MVEFGADAHRKQVDIKQLYNQVPQMAWVSWISSWSQLVGVWVAVWGSENKLQTEGLGPQGPSWAAQQNEEEVQLQPEELGVNMLQSVPSPTHLSHITNINPFATLSQPFQK